MTPDPTDHPDPDASGPPDHGDARASMVVALAVIFVLTAVIVTIAYLAVGDLPPGH